MEKVVSVAVYGFTAHQSVLLSPFIRKIWNVGKIRQISSDSKLDAEIEGSDLLIVNGSLDFFELEYSLSFAKKRADIQIACIAFNALTSAGYETLCRYDVPILIAGLKSENDISLCKDRIAKMGSFRITSPSEEVVESDYHEDFERLSPNEKYVTVCMLKGMKQESIAREMGLSPSTVGTYFSRIYKKCGVFSRNDLYRKFAI